MESIGPRWFVAGDLDGFFGLFFSGFPDLLLIASLTPLCGLPQQLVTGRILPASHFPFYSVIYFTPGRPTEWRALPTATMSPRFPLA